MKITPLHDRHVALGARIIDFGGWAMPVQYTNVIEEHRATRTAAGLFDICHMGEIEVRGPQAFDLLQWVMSRNLAEQRINQMKLSLVLNDRGGIVDDLTVYKFAEDDYLVVTNAGTMGKVFARLIEARDRRGFDCRIFDRTEETSKLDLQGPASQAILQGMVAADLSVLGYYESVRTTLLGVPALVSRSGYTGEDGFEIYTANDPIGMIWDTLLERGKPHGLKPVGLGARDTLRLEAGMMLYGSEMNEDITPYEVVYGWLVDPAKDFLGRDALMQKKAAGFEKKLVGFEMEGRGIARHGYPVVAADGRVIGEVTSGTMSPTLNKAIGLGFVTIDHKEPGTGIGIQIRDNTVKAKTVKLPFYKRSNK